MFDDTSIPWIQTRVNVQILVIVYKCPAPQVSSTGS